MGKKTTKGLKKTKVRRRLKQILSKHNADDAFNPIMALIDEYDEEMIVRLNLYRMQIHNKEMGTLQDIVDALNLTIRHHGPITEKWVPSAAKRLHGHFFKLDRRLND